DSGPRRPSRHPASAGWGHPHPPPGPSGRYRLLGRPVPGRSLSMASVSVRYIVDDVDEAIDFYCRLLDFEEVMHPAPTFAMLARGDLRLVLSAPGGGP